ncbi:MAG: TIGR00295 family protein [Thermoplasmata archaeon]|nr:TIGR00295 family protein [Thermoplasmata archaeon]
MSIPSAEECIDLLRKVGCPGEVIKHSLLVRDIAVEIAKCANADVKLVEAGALLHDIGRSKTHGIMHGVEGAKIARKLGLPKVLVNIIEHHLGAGISLEEAKKLGLPPKDYTPKTLEEKIVAHADNLTEGSRKQSIKEAIEKEIKRGKAELAKKMLRLHEELSNYCGIDIDEIELKQ